MDGGGIEKFGGPGDAGKPACKGNILQYTVYIAHYTLYIVNCILYTVQYMVYIVQCTVYFEH